MKQTIRITEGELHDLVSESVRKVLSEVERSFPNAVPGDDGIHYPGDINPDVWDALQRGDFGQGTKDRLSDVLTGMDGNTASFIAGEIMRESPELGEFIVNHMNNYV